MPLIYGAQGVNAGLRGQATNVIELKASECYVLPAGSWAVVNGLYTAVQQYDPVTGIWRAIGDDGRGEKHITSDGVNFRVANQTGCLVGALITNAGTGYTSAPTCTPSAGSAVLSCIVGGAVATSVTVTNGGTTYAYPPIVVFDAPPAGGIQATGFCAITAGAVSSVTITDQGAGYASAPAIYFKPDPRDTTGSGAAATATLTGAGTVTGILVTDHGNAVTTLPTLAFSGGGGASAAATALMCWSITAYAVTTAGTSYTGAVEITAIDGSPTTAPAYVNPSTQLKLVRKRKASIIGALSSGGFTATGQIVDDGGIYDSAPNVIINTSPISVVGATPAALTLTMGGNNDKFELYAA
jgi:hypothetical protein